MKDTEIHNGLPEKEIRDFFSEQIMDNVMSGETIPHKYTPNLDPYVQALYNQKIDLENCQNEIKRLERMIAVRTLLKLKGWEEWDCSNSVLRSTPNRGWLNFIGTEEEFKKFMKDNDFKE